MVERNLIIYRIKKKKGVVYFFEFIFYQWKSQVKKQLFPILLPREQKQTFKEGTPKPKKKKTSLFKISPRPTPTNLISQL